METDAVTTTTMLLQYLKGIWIGTSTWMGKEQTDVDPMQANGNSITVSQHGRTVIYQYFPKDRNLEMRTLVVQPVEHHHD